MKPHFAIIAIALIASVAIARADDYVRYKAKPVGSTARIDGKSSVHPWSMEDPNIGGWIDVPAGVKLDSTEGAIAGAPADGKIAMHASARLPVTSFKNGHFEGMDEVMYQAMESDKFEAIEFSLTGIVLKQPHTAGTPFQFDAAGDLTIHGVTKKISMPVTIETVDKTKLKVVATSVPVNMTDYGIKPPVKAAIFTTEPEVKISFEWLVALPKTAAK